MAKAKRTVIARSHQLYIAPLLLEHAPDLFRWINDPKVYGHLRDIRRFSPLEEQKQWILNVPRDPTLQVYAVYYLPDDRLIGYGGFKNIVWEDKIGEIWRVIGETGYHGQGLGTELYGLVCQVGFQLHGFKNILAEHYANNPASLKSALKAGAKLVGVRRQAKEIQDQRFDVFYTDILPEDLDDRWDCKIKGPPHLSVLPLAG